MEPIQILSARSNQDIQCTRAIFRSYASWLARDYSIDLAFQGIEEELAQLPGKYAPPGGEILLARNEADEVVGVIALRPFEGVTCEIKRLYVLPQARGQSVGKRLIGQIIEVAKNANYERAILDTGAFMQTAQKLYETFGFTDIPAYYDNPFANMRFMGANLNKIK